MSERQIGELDIVTDWVFSGSVYGPGFEATVMNAGATPVGGYMYARSSSPLPVDADGNRVPHETMANVYVGFDNYLISSGALTYIAEWSSGNISRSEIEAYRDYIESTTFAYAIENVSLTDTELTWDVVARDTTDGPHGLIKFMPDCPFKCVVRDADTSLVCIIRDGLIAGGLNAAGISVAGGETVTVSKTGSSFFIVLTEDGFDINDNAVAGCTITKLVSSSASIRNTGSAARSFCVVYE